VAFLGVRLAASLCYGVLIFAVIQPDWHFSVAFWLFQAIFALAFMAWAFRLAWSRQDGPRR
jgi:hypothetical protein